MGRLKLLGAGATILAAACGGEPEQQSAIRAACAGEGIVVTDAWARAARPGQPTSAAYVTLCNGGSGEDSLVGAEMAGVDAVELHVTRQSPEGIVSMAPTDRVALPTSEAVSLAPGGAHFMLIGLGEGVSRENPPTLRLKFEHAPPQEIVLDVREDGDL